MRGYKILEHTSELKIRAFGGTKKELFLNMMLGMLAVLRAETQNPKPKIQNKIEIKSQDINALLVDFLSEVLYLAQVNKGVYDDVKFKKFSGTELEGELIGQKVERFGEDIKAVTYYGVKIKKNKYGLWQVDVIYDI